eukprot:g16818.t1
MDIKDIVLDWRLHLSAIVITVIAEAIGVIKVPIGFGAILLLPLLYAFVLGLLINPNVVSAAKVWIKDRDVKAASPMIVIAIMPFIAKFGTIIGPSMETIIAAGPALILQELGNLATIILAFPVAVLVLRMGRESIGACFSVAREPNIAIIADKYGLKSQEGAGVMGVYVIGTLFGTFIFAILASILATTGMFSIEALAMACGIGSGSMMAACSGALVSAVPEMKDQILALAGASNVLTYATGMYLCVFVALPVTEKLYDWLGVVALVGNTVATDNTVPEGLVGLIVLWLICMVGLLLTEFVPFKLPSVAWISLVGIVMTLPWTPGSAWVLEKVGHVNFLTLATPCLAYAGIAIAKREIEIAKTSGWKIAVVAVLVMTGTYVGSAIVAQMFL